MDWLDEEEPTPRVRHRVISRRSRSFPRGRTHPRKFGHRIPKCRALQDDRAAMYDHYSCYTCDKCNCCCTCPDPRPVVRVPVMYVIDARDGTIRRLTYYETLSNLETVNHDVRMEYRFRLRIDPTAWHSGPPDPLNVRYERPRYMFDEED